MPYLEIKVANKGTPKTNPKNGEIHPSTFGHVWYHIYKDEFDIIGKSYGFGPDSENQGKPFAPGKVYYNDSVNYFLNKSDGDYIGRVYITDTQYDTLDKFGDEPTNYKFSRQYNGINNSCIDFTWTALAKAGLTAVDVKGDFFDGDILPTWNIDNFQKLINSINNSTTEIPAVPYFTLKSPFDLGLTNSEFISKISDYYGIDPVTTINSNPDYFSNVLGYGGAKISSYEGNISNFLKNQKLTVNQDLFKDATTYKNQAGQEYTIIKDSSVTLFDNSTALLSSVIEMAQTAKEVTVKFVDGYMREVKDLFTTGDGMASLISDVSAGIEKGLAPEQIAKIVATKLVVKTAMSEIRNSFLLSDSDLALLNQGKKISELSTEGQRALSNFAANHPIYNTAYLAAISFATTLLLNMNEGWDSHQYTMATVEATAQAATQTAIAIATSKGWLSMSSSVGAGVGGAAAYIISAAVKDMFADDHMNSHQWQSTVVSAGIIGAAAWAGCAMAIALIGGAFAGPIGAVVASIIVSQFMGGKEFKEGEYPNPYDFIKIVPKEDGTGNNIYAIEAGALLKAVEGKNDDLFGTNSSDIAIGASGNNTIIGYDGNDHIEGRGDIDYLIGGGNGDDALAIEFRGYC